LHLYATNRETAEYNIEQLKKLNEPIVRIDAKHTGGSMAKKAKANNAEGLHSFLFLAKGARIMLRKNLWTKAGLVNGAMGSIIDIIYHPDSTPGELPLAVLVQFDKYTGPSWSNELDRVVPITPHRAEWKFNGKCLTHTQLPICLAYAVTIYKSQGITLEKVWIDIGNRNYANGSAFTAISRCKTLAGIILVTYCYERYTKKLKNPKMFVRLKEEARLKTLFHNFYQNN
jgi:ATP-dependent exoDNAse (exonuclease V) alpha subunit